MATLTKEQIEQLSQQYKEKTQEAKAIYNKLVEADACPLDDVDLDQVVGGFFVSGRQGELM